MKRLRRSYTLLEMDKGEGMVFHPVNGGKISELFFHEGSRIYARKLSCYVGGGFEDLARIGNGKEHLPGDPYPSHWQFDPETGMKLSKIEKKEPTRIVCTGWEMD